MTEMQKLMGKTKFEEILGDLIYKPPGKPTLVPASDKRPAMNVSLSTITNLTAIIFTFDRKQKHI